MKLLTVAALVALAAVSNAATWKVHTNNIMTVAMGVAAPTAGECYVSGSQDGVGSLILHIQDGQDWVSIPHEPQMMYMDISFSDRFGAASGLGMFNVVNGLSVSQNGTSFENAAGQFFASAFQNVEAAANNTFYAVGFWQETLSGDDFGYGVVGSFDGGETIQYFPWTIDEAARYGSFPTRDTWFLTGGHWPVSSKQNPKLPRSFGKGGFRITEKLTVDFASPKPAIHLTEQEDDVKRDDYTGVIAKTTDAGRTWQLLYSDVGRFYFNGIDCVDVNQCWAVAEGPAGAYILATRDGGATWEEQLFDAGRGLFQVKFLSRSEGWAVGGVLAQSGFDGIFYHTVDGGLTWDGTTHVVKGAYPATIDFSDPEHGWATAFMRVGGSSVLAYN